MTKEEVLSFGVPEERYRDFQALYYRDINKAENRIKRKNVESDPSEDIIKAIYAMLRLIKQPNTLQQILTYINKLYYTET